MLSKRSVHIFFIFFAMLIMPGADASAATVEYFFSVAQADQTKTTSGWSVVPGSEAAPNTVPVTPGGWIDGSNFTVGDRYLIMAWGNHNASVNSNRTGFRVTHGGTSFTESEGVEEVDQTNVAYKTPYFWFTVWTAANEDVQLEYYNATAGGTARAEGSKLLMINAEGLIADGSLQYVIQTTGGTLTTTFATKATLTWTPATNANTWWIMSYSRGNIDTTGGDAYSARLQIDGVNNYAQIIDGEDAADTPIYGLGWAQTFSNASHTVNLQIRETVGNQQWLAAGIFALRLNYFNDFGINATVGSQAMNAGDDLYNQLATVTKTVFGSTHSWLIAAGAVIDDNNARTTGYIQMDNTTAITNENGGWQAATTDQEPFTAANVRALGGGNSHTFDFDARETNNTTNPVAWDTWLIAIALGPVRPDSVVTAQE